LPSVFAQEIVPDPPASIAAEQAGNGKQINVSWTASPTEGVISYQVYRSTSNSQLGTLVLDNYESLSYGDQNVSYKTTYYYQIFSILGNQVSATSRSVNLKPVVPVPANVKAEDTTLGREVKISWDRAALDIVLKYNVYRSNNDSDLGGAVAWNVAGTEYLNTGLEEGVSYYYRVKSIAPDGTESEASDVAYTSSSDKAASGAPTGVSAAYLGSGQARISWGAPSGDAISYYLIFRSSSPSGAGSQIADAKSTSYTDGAISVGGTYYYTVKAVDKSGNISSPSAPAKLSLDSVASDTENVSNLIAEETGANGQIKLTWKNPASFGFSFVRIYRNTVSQSLGGLVADNVRGQSFTDNNLGNGITYYYIVRAVNKDGSERQENIQASAAPRVNSSGEAPPPPVVRLRVKDLGTGNSIMLSWRNPELTQYQYIKIYRSAEKGVLGDPLFNRLRDNTYTDYANISADQKYYYTVKTVNNNGVESENNIVIRGIATQALPGEGGSNDTDGDGLPDSWERENGFHVRLKDLIDEDEDEDGLGLYAEYQQGTDPWNPDSDEDGYTDGTEALNGYNPLGTGRKPRQAEVASTIKTGNFVYGKTRLASLGDEQALARELRVLLENDFGDGKIPNPRSHWPTLVNAYVYGGYSAAEIAHTLRYGPGLVHPAILANEWRLSEEYKRKS